MGWVIRVQVNAKIMNAVHTCVHHKNGGFDGGALARLQDHRTDGQ